MRRFMRRLMRRLDEAIYAAFDLQAKEERLPELEKRPFLS